MGSTGHPEGVSDGGHRITVEQGTQRVRVEIDGQVLAESDRPVLLHEAGFPVRYYLPPQDVRMDLLEVSESHTVCPFKGTASYWSLPGGRADVAWTYLEPLPRVAPVKGLLCFYDAQAVEG
ncbi:MULTISPECIES: DUF427 domain-containing protein [unclassified Streptomyces]|uniref:DUF427 domain-containing protein n=1 Tax=unclassified Streptomyces TaxID=2593676 RepID=UPI0022B6270B|nr:MULTISPECIES: DUF427 domain-containing protein [unclassified Streptomyces]MCZ7413214.1 DUF427 domain-containing protein [Streptomyces sp. WMMC897]MCZ7430207.1 DUF427 domain-containing protein [Streptomyces sp. WMMC1477]